MPNPLLREIQYKKFMFRVSILILTAIIFVSSASAQETTRKNSNTSSGETDSKAKAEFLAAFKKMRAAPKIRIISETNINNKLLTNATWEYVAPNKYYRLLKKNREGKKFEFEGVEIAGQHFEKKGDKWVREANPMIVLKDEIDVVRAPKFGSSKKDLFKITSLSVKYLGEENSGGKTFKIYKYTLIDEALPTQGKVWIKDGLPVRQESSTLPGCLNTIIGSVEYEYEAEIIIQKPQTARK